MALDFYSSSKFSFSVESREISEEQPKFTILCSYKPIFIHGYRSFLLPNIDYINKNQYLNIFMTCIFNILEFFT